ncbi:MAG: alpha/beta hydrolase [Bacteroidales bacterium]|nr:alpha/beta hydrolase [Bacteroidales bacterium]
MEYSIQLQNGQVLRGFISSPGEKMRSIFIFVHGIGEHIRRYKPWAGLLNSEGVGFTGVDLPGHGRSDGRRGHISSFSLTDEMIDILIGNVRKTFPGIPVLFYGHSLGGTIVLDYLLRRKPDIKGAVVTSPWLKLSFEPEKYKVVLASVVKYVLPGLIQPAGLVAEHISRDAEVVKGYVSDPLNHDYISVSLFNSTISAAKRSLENASALHVPLLLLHGSADMICSPDGSREFASAAAMSELKIWDGGYHELHNEPFKKEVFDYLVSWINRLLGSA